MNDQQVHWWEQTRSDHGVLFFLRRSNAAPCHQLHYLQMVTEKPGKAYFWRTGSPPPKSHVSFVSFIQALDNRKKSERDRIAVLFGFGRVRGLKEWIRNSAPLAHDLERLAPALAGDNGPNPEYPWPFADPVNAPATHRFQVWERLKGTGSGRQLLTVIDRAVTAFPQYA